MIDWLVQSASAHPCLARGVAPVGLLSPAEQGRMAQFTFEKRRRDWLLGRWTAKRLLQGYAERRTGVRPASDAITIASAPDGAPRVVVEQPAGLREALAGLHVSISHCHGQALCAISSQAGAPIGADIERVEPRDAGFAGDYFTASELAQISAADPSARDMLVTLIWSAKEAALKALRLGLTVDTRSVAIELGQPPHGPGLAWAPLVARASLAPGEPPLLLHGWWRLVGEYVLTLALTQAPSAP